MQDMQHIEAVRDHVHLGGLIQALIAFLKSLGFLLTPANIDAAITVIENSTLPPWVKFIFVAVLKYLEQHPSQIPVTH